MHIHFNRDDLSEMSDKFDVNSTFTVTYKANSVVKDYIDLLYAEWVFWLLWPLVVTILLPVVILLLLYLSALILYVYKHRYHIHEAYSHSVWDGARKTIAALWLGHGSIWHGYEVVGMENIPSEGAGLLVYYHGVIPLDFYYVLSKILLIKGRLIHAVGDRFLFKIPGWQSLMAAFNVIPGTVDECAAKMREGNLLGISPGGVREAQFSDHHYRLLWGKRVGFAKAAIKANAPVIPMFTQNIREAFRCIQFGRKYFLKLYERTRIPLVPLYGGFPVKLRTYIGEPIYPKEDTTPEQLAQETAAAIEDLIAKHQRVPGSIIAAILSRFPIIKHKISEPEHGKPDEDEATESLLQHDS